MCSLTFTLRIIRYISTFIITIIIIVTVRKIKEISDGLVKQSSLLKLRLGKWARIQTSVSIIFIDDQYPSFQVNLHMYTHSH